MHNKICLDCGVEFRAQHNAKRCHLCAFAYGNERRRRAAAVSNDMRHKKQPLRTCADCGASIVARKIRCSPCSDERRLLTSRLNRRKWKEIRSGH